MLVLSRKKGEVIYVGESITIRVMEIRGDKVRIGIEAPQDTPIHRQEIWQAIHGGEDRDIGEPVA